MLTKEEMAKAFLTGAKAMSDSSMVVAILQTAIETIEKQIPMKPRYESDGDADGRPVYDTWICEGCGTAYEMEIDDYKFCPNCGQAIDWEEIKEATHDQF